jgi:uncharacterized protein (TIGR00251 family)
MATLIIRVQPRAKQSEVVGRHGDAIKIRLAAPPVDGAANDELIRFLAEQLGVPRSAVTIVSGAAARTKRVDIASVDAKRAEARLLAASPSHSDGRPLR